jgi:hypothetical protein
MSANGLRPPELPPATTDLRFTADMDSFDRILGQATPVKRPAVFAQLSREGVRWISAGMPKPDVIDALRTVGLTAELTEDQISEALGKAVDDPFIPPEPHAAVKAMAAKTPAALVIQRASEIEPQEIAWLWPGRIALGKQTIIAGEPGLGKSQLTCAVAAAVTAERRWPANEGVAPSGSVIILSAEDDAADTIRPRLDAAGADVSRVYIVSAVKTEDGKGRRSFNLQADLLLLENEIIRIGDVKLVVVDPVSSYLGKVDSHRNAELRAVLEPIGEMAARMGVAVLSVTHLSKGGTGGSANARVIGSIAFVAAARAAFIVCRDPDDNERRLFLPTKNNLAHEGTGLGFRVGGQVTVTGIVAPSIFWDSDPVVMTANEALNRPAEYGSAPARNEAEDFLRNLLADGPMPSRNVQSEAKAAGIAWATVRRAKETLGIKAAKSTLDGGWAWALPAQDAHP